VLTVEQLACQLITEKKTKATMTSLHSTTAVLSSSCADVEVMETDDTPSSASNHCRQVNTRTRNHSGGDGDHTAVIDTRHRAHLVRDATQPRTGSIASVRSVSPSADDIDSDDLTPLPRARAQTCPDAMGKQRRKARLRSSNRPPTPPPSDISRQLASHEVTRTKVKLRVSDVDLSRNVDCVVDEKDELLEMQQQQAPGQ
jgi:hypothetical protein